VSRQVEEQLSVLLAPLAQIRSTPSETVEQIKIKQRLYKSLESKREPFRLVADLWCSTFPAGRVTDEQYQEAIGALTQPRKFAEIAKRPWFMRAIELARRPDMLPFHWELEFIEAFYGEDGRLPDAGFDAIIGNPPYEVLSELESNRDLSAIKAFIEHEPVYEPSRTGKNNLYKLFVCRVLELLADGGFLGFITPMAILGDKITAELRKRITQVASFTSIEAFPQKDDPANRVFPEAKLSTAVFGVIKTTADAQRFRARVHPRRFIEANSPSYVLSTAEIPLYDPLNFTIVSCSQADWNLATRIMSTGRLIRLRQFAEFSQGEVNETNERHNGNLTNDASRGALVIRGASVCLYVTRAASQGRDLLIDVHGFLQDKQEDTKAFHHRHRRVCWQESSPQNNFRRVIAALVPAGRFCNHKINYLPEHASKLPLELVLGLLNSRLIDWYFRLGSTNAAVSHYQMYNLPCPMFADGTLQPDGGRHDVRTVVGSGQLGDAYNLLKNELAEPPFSASVARRHYRSRRTHHRYREQPRRHSPRGAIGAGSPRATLPRLYRPSPVRDGGFDRARGSRSRIAVVRNELERTRRAIQNPFLLSCSPHKQLFAISVPLREAQSPSLAPSSSARRIPKSHPRRRMSNDGAPIPTSLPTCPN
jgi:hypothetical protein